MNYVIKNVKHLNFFIGNPEFRVWDVQGPKPSSKEYKNNKGTWIVKGFFKNEDLRKLNLAFKK